jgi:hypothetical protein
MKNSKWVVIRALKVGEDVLVQNTIVPFEALRNLRSAMKANLVSKVEYNGTRVYRLAA